MPRAQSDGREHRRRDGQNQGAGRRHHQQCHGVIKRALLRCGPGKGRQTEAEPPNEKHRQRKPKHPIGVKRAEFIGEQL